MLSESLTEKCVEYGASQLPAISEELSLKLNVSEATQEQLAKKKSWQLSIMFYIWTNVK